MIRMYVSAAFQIRDGFSGRIVEGNQLRCTLDGVAVRPIVKQGGYLVFVNLSSGSHRLILQSDRFQAEHIDFVSRSDGLWEGYVALKPTEQYFFHYAVTWLHLVVKKDGTPLCGQELWLTPPGAPECKVAQTRAEVGCTELRLYCKTPNLLLLPGAALIDDGTESEIVTLLELTDETGRLAFPLQQHHSRNRIVLPAQAYRTNETGRISAVFSAPGTVVVYAEGMDEPKRLELTDTNNTLEITIGKS